MNLPHHYKQLEERDFLGHWDIDKPTEVTIKSIEVEEVFNPGNKKKEKRVVAEFQGAKKKMILNRTNQARIAGYHGVDPNGWEGKKVTIYRTTTKLKGEEVECLRIK